MGYLFLFISAISGTIKGFFGKKISDNINGLEGAIFTNFIRMIFCIPIGLVFVFFDGNFSDLAVSREVLLISLFAGISTSIFIVSWLLAVKKSAFTSLDAFISLGIIVPILLSNIFYEEKVSLSQFIGIILLLGGVFIMSLYNNQIKQKIGLPSLILFLIVGLANGFVDFSYKIFQHTKADTPASVFNFYIYIFSAVTLLTVFMFLHFTHQREAVPDSGEREVESLIDKKKTIYIAIMAIFLFCNSYFKTLAASLLTSVQMYPLAQGASILFALLMSSIFLKEKIKPLCIAGLTILFISLLFINVIVF